jgi:ADP-L-glycero-D-manno-heptose 6-epimerase
MFVVTGSKGFIGQELVDHLQSQGHKVYAMDWQDRGRTWTADEPIEWIYHMGAISSTDAVDWEELLVKNIQDTQEWIRFAEQHGCGITYASSASIYGPWTGSPEWGPVQPQHLYGVSKLAIDNWCAEQTFSVPVQGVRFFNVYGRKEQHKKQPSPVRRFLNQAATERQLTVWHHNGRFGSRDFISIDDTIQGMEKLRAAAVSGVYNIGTGKTDSFYDIAKTCQRLQGVTQCKLFSVPMPVAMLATYQWESRANLDKLHRVIPDWNPENIHDWLERNWQILYNQTIEDMNNEI